MQGKVCFVAAAAALALTTPRAFANGRYPNADMLLVDPSEPRHLVLRATFGTLVSTDQGNRWYWICEESIGYTGDPVVTVLASGVLMHAFLGNITVSTADACSFERVPFVAEGRNAIDITLDPVDRSHAWVLASGLNMQRQASLIEVSTDAATPLTAADDFVPSTVEISQSRPERMYVVGFDVSFQSTLLVSDDRGQSWSVRPIQPYAALPMYLSAVDPVDPDTLYIRVDGGTADHLLVSRDAGQSFVEVLTIEAEMLGFALSPDGTRVAAGGPDGGLWVANTADFVFAPAAPIVSLRCLTWAHNGLYACAQESLDGWTLAVSADSGQTFTPLWHVQDLEPLRCEASTPVESVCPRSWLDISAQIGADLVPDGVPNSMARAPEPAKANSSCAAAPVYLGPRRDAATITLSALMLAAMGRVRLRRRLPSGAGS